MMDGIYQINNLKNVSKSISKLNSLKDYQLLILGICEYFISNHDLVNNHTKYNPKVNDIILYNSRVYIFYTDKKYVSAYFPFNYNHNNQIFHYNASKIDLSTISHLKTIINGSDTFDDIQNFIAQCNVGIQPSDQDYITDEEFRLAFKIFKLEPCYVRYDMDEKHAKLDFHPLHHLDIHMSKFGRLKIGLRQHISPQRFTNMFLPHTPCEHIEDPTKASRYKQYIKHLYKKSIGRLTQIKRKRLM